MRQESAFAKWNPITECNTRWMDKKTMMSFSTWEIYSISMVLELKDAPNKTHQHIFTSASIQWSTVPVCDKIQLAEVYACLHKDACFHSS